MQRANYALRDAYSIGLLIRSDGSVNGRVLPFYLPANHNALLAFVSFFSRHMTERRRHNEG